MDGIPYLANARLELFFLASGCPVLGCCMGRYKVLPDTSRMALLT
jgi:hypothetical protein